MIGCLTETTTCVVAKPLVEFKELQNLRSDLTKKVATYNEELESRIEKANEIILAILQY